MKLINYNYGCALKGSSTWYRGKILMSRNEWREAQIYLMNPAVLAKLQRSTQQMSVAGTGLMLREDMERKTETRDGFRVGVRVSATDAIVRHFKPTNARQYKRQNYFVHVLTK